MEGETVSSGHLLRSSLGVLPTQNSPPPGFCLHMNACALTQMHTHAHRRTHTRTHGRAVGATTPDIKPVSIEWTPLSTTAFGQAPSSRSRMSRRPWHLSPRLHTQTGSRFPLGWSPHCASHFCLPVSRSPLSVVGMKSPHLCETSVTAVV